jgi:hypothetical protein
MVVGLGVELETVDLSGGYVERTEGERCGLH